MSFWDKILGRPVPVAMFTPRVEHIGGGSDMIDYLGDAITNGTAASLWKSQPHLRTVVTFLARNIAQLGLHVYERIDETDRRRDRTSPAARALRAPDGVMTGYDLIYALVVDALLYDRAYWFIGPSTSTSSGFMVRRLPPSWVSPHMADPFTVDHYVVTLDGRTSEKIPPDQILDFTGYSPTAPHRGSPTVEALRDTLREQVEASRYRQQVWKRGGRVSAVIERPENKPWSEAARKAFREDWYARFTGNGPGAGGTPILEDGMKLTRVDFNARDQQFVEASKLSLVTVAAAFHVNPTMIGQNDGANYSNVREFRKMLYGDTLGPLISQFEARLNGFMLPMFGMDPDRHYVEFNIAEKLQGNFEEQAQALQTSVGGPWMTRAEARARLNLPTLEGSESLLFPLNLSTGPMDGSDDSTTDPAPTEDTKSLLERVNAAAALIRSGFDPAAAMSAAGLPPVTHLGLLPVTVRDEAKTDEAKAADVVSRHISRWFHVVKSNPAAANDRVRWDRELTQDLAELMPVEEAASVASAVNQQLGDPNGVR